VRITTAHRVVLTDAQLDQLAEGIADRLRIADISLPSRELVDARTVAQTLDVDVKSVYRHSTELGAVRVGRRLRFDLDRALRSWPSGESDRCPSERSQPPETSAPTPTPGARQRPPGTAHCQLLPVGRRTGAP
jgi:hypothetical protein